MEDEKTVREIRQLVSDFFQDPHKTNLWFCTPNPSLGDISPDHMIRLGKEKKLLAFIKEQLAVA